MEKTVTQHTPGPWNWVLEGGEYKIEAELGFTRVASAPAEQYHSAKANARLIAAAPELLGVLKRYQAMDVAKCMLPEDPLFAACNAVIAKAEGRV